MHPSTTDDTLNDAFGSSEEDVTYARKLVSAYEEAAVDGRGSVMLGDTFIDNANYRHARRLLDRS